MRKMTLGTKLRDLRHKRKLSLDALSIQLGTSKAAIGKWESDQTKPTIENLLKLCAYYDTDIYKLFEGVSNITVNNIKFTGHSYVGYAQNFTVNNHILPEQIATILENQNQITSMIENQNNLILKLIENK